MFLPNFLPGYGAVTVASLVSTGRATIAGISLSIDGDATTPAINWVSDTNLGILRDSADNLRISANGSAVHAFSTAATAALGAFSTSNGATIDGGDLIMGTGRAVVLDAGSISDCAMQFAGDPNSGIYWTSADRWEQVANGGDVLSIRNQLAISYLSHSLNSIQGVTGNLITVASAHNLKLASGYIEMSEIAAPGAGAADTVRIYAVVDGGSLTDLSAVFQDGDVVAFAQQT